LRSKKIKTFLGILETGYKSFYFTEKMVENGVAVRRSRRAASLTAQVLWNFQIEGDINNNKVLRWENGLEKCE